VVNRVIGLVLARLLGAYLDGEAGARDTQINLAKVASVVSGVRRRTIGAVHRVVEAPMDARERRRSRDGRGMSGHAAQLHNDRR
jgi:hypothetical protein